MIPTRQVRAVYDGATIRVYQAYSDDIADSALQRGTFVAPPFKTDRMTWIKPSFLWMMCRAGWGKKDLKQKRILAIDIRRNGFEWALNNCTLTQAPSTGPKAPEISGSVLVQWDPERDIWCRHKPEKAIQIGLRGEAVSRYLNHWIVKITDVTNLALSIRSHLDHAEFETATALLPQERPYPLDKETAGRCGITAAQ